MKTFRILGLALVVTGLLFAGCKKTEDEDEEEEGTVSLDVSAPTEPQNKNVLLEEFTGNNCQYCPDGHKRVNELIAANSGRLIGINIHEGSLAQLYKTEFGPALYQAAKPSGIPAGTINRILFDGDTAMALNRGYFSYRANQVLAQPACANIAAKASINKSTRELTVAVAVYYTGTPTGSTNMINVAITQDSVWGSQKDPQNLYPEAWNSDHSKYCHMHMLRHLVTGQWGDAITPATGKQIKKEYKYTIPASISNVDMVLENLNVIAFVCEGHANVINVCEAPLTIR